jgi:hypothetical protein
MAAIVLTAIVLTALGVAFGTIGSALAETTVEVLATDPPGAVVTLGRNQNFYLRIGYTSDQPINIWARPYFLGREVKAGTNPSGKYTGTGEVLGWFFLMQPGDEVDEIRILAGDGSRDGTHPVATYPVRIVGGSQPAGAHTEPAWVVEMRQRVMEEQQAAHERRMNTPTSAGERAFFTGFMFVMLGLGLLAFAAPAWGLWRWRGGWRIAAAVPAVTMAFVVLRILTGVARDPTSHNLWPFEILQAGALSIVIMALLLVVRKFAGAGR